MTNGRLNGDGYNIQPGQQLKRNRVVSKRNAKRDYVLRGMLICRCGRKMSGRTTTGGLSYYVCSAHSESPNLCDQKLVRAEKIEQFVWHQIERFFRNGRLVRLALYKAQRDELKSLQPKRDELKVAGHGPRDQEPNERRETPIL